MYLKSVAKCTLLLGVVASLLSGCTRSLSDVDSAGQTQHPIFPDKESAVFKEGIIVTTERMALLKKGLTKPQLYDLMGVPHFKEGVWGVKEWDYIIKVKENDGLKTCQLKVLFNKDMVAQSYYYLPENCLTAKPSDKMLTVSSEKVFSSEALFNFNSAELRVDGLQEIAEFASELPDNVNIKVTGYTDRLGSASYNNMLSAQRAEAIKDYLVAQGVERDKIMAVGMGANDPLVECSGNNQAQLIACLSPNRRVTIDIIQ
ncbi:OmpA family protein [uncultured Pluralibacter sp.]|uniref:OmpA family protein n=1 Tax=uncultured Pluralibacter sp. TaxID=1490864 RepID=UPI00260D821B|nr:OmpA family protein [uncultured Pluralibacter sp.]